MPRGVVLLIVVLSGWLLILLGRRFLVVDVESPAFCVTEKTTGIPVRLGTGFPEPGIHQIIDASPARVVIELTNLRIPAPEQQNVAWRATLQAGEVIDLEVAGGVVTGLRRTLLPAQQRLLLGVPLHPDRMERADWEALPGVGPKLAAAIMADRQRNGDFGSLEGVDRVKGVGPGRIRQWRSYFSCAGIEEQPIDNTMEK